MDFWDKKNAANLNPLVQVSDERRSDSHSLVPDTNDRLLDVARSRGYTTQGEMFYSSQLAELAQAFGYQARVVPNVTLKDIQECVDRGHPALVPFDVDKQGNPGLFNGSRAHWAVIEGHFQKDGQEYLVATHGWTGKEYVWRAEDFLASVNQVNESDFPGVPKDITGILRGRMVEGIAGLSARAASRLVGARVEDVGDDAEPEGEQDDSPGRVGILGELQEFPQ